MARRSGGGGGTKKLQIGDLLQMGIIMGYSRSISIAVVAIAVVCSCIYILQILFLNAAAGFNPYSRTSLLQCTLLDQNQSSILQITSSESSRSNSSRTQNSYTQQQQQEEQQQHNNINNIVIISELNESPGPKSRSGGGTELSRIVFGIATAAKNWSRRKEYIKLWWNSSSCCNNRNNNSSCCNNKNSSCSSTRMRGFVWLDEEVNETTTHWSEDWPPYKISEDVSDKSRFSWSDAKRKWGVRISRIVSETFRLGLPNVDWFVLGDDDTFFFPQNLVKVLSRYDHTQMRYIGSFSETHSQNIMLFSYNMAFGGGGFAISFPLAQALAQMQDECNFRYPTTPLT